VPIPYGYTRGNTAARIAYLKESIEAIEDGYTAGSDVIEYPNAGRLEQLKRADAEGRLRQLYTQYAKLIGDKDLLAEVQTGPRFVRVVGTPNYVPGFYSPFGFGWGRCR